MARMNAIVTGSGGLLGSACVGLLYEEGWEGIYRLMRSDYDQPLNLGTDRLISINKPVEIVAKIAGKRIRKEYDLTKPQGRVSYGKPGGCRR